MINTLFLKLEGPLQSWGERARWDVRDTAPEPTKSGVIGLLGCALGWNDDEQLARLSRQLRMGVRCDRPGELLVDYHTIVGGVMSAEGKVKINAKTHLPETVVSQRFYLSDAAFLIALQGDPALVAQLADAVQRPRWPIYLGRKSCPPSRPPFDGIGAFPTLEQALASRPICLVGAQQSSASVRAVIECGPSEGIRRRDEVKVPSLQVFLPRYTRDVELSVPVAQEVLPCTSPA